MQTLSTNEKLSNEIITGLSKQPNVKRIKVMLKSKNNALLAKTPDTDFLFKKIKSHIENARMLPAVTVNQSLTQLNRNIGGIIYHHILEGNRAAYGKEILATLSQQLSWIHFIELITLEKWK